MPVVMKISRNMTSRTSVGKYDFVKRTYIFNYYYLCNYTLLHSVMYFQVKWHIWLGVAWFYPSEFDWLVKSGHCQNKQWMSVHQCRLFISVIILPHTFFFYIWPLHHTTFNQRFYFLKYFGKALEGKKKTEHKSVLGLTEWRR